MKNLLIENSGLLQALDITSLGLSSKRNDSSKIGQFGSGWKYALAWLIRNDIIPKIYSGETEYVIDTIAVTHRDDVVTFITVNGRQTDISTGFGEIDWTVWMALRELISNALDEEDFRIDTNAEVAPAEGKTRVFIPMVPEVLQVMTNYHDYFTFNRIPSYENKLGRVFIKAEETPMRVFRKGILCYTGDKSKSSYLDFDFNDVQINESRLTNPYHAEVEAKKLLSNCDREDVLLAALKALYMDIKPYTVTEIMKPALLRISGKYMLKTMSEVTLLGVMGSGVLGDNTLICPTKWRPFLQELYGEQKQPEVINGAMLIEVEDQRAGLLQYYCNNFGLKKRVAFAVIEYDESTLITDDVIYISTNYDRNAEEVMISIIKTLDTDILLPIMSPLFK